MSEKPPFDDLESPDDGRHGGKGGKNKSPRYDKRKNPVPEKAIVLPNANEDPLEIADLTNGLITDGQEGAAATPPAKEGSLAPTADNNPASTIVPDVANHTNAVESPISAVDKNKATQTPLQGGTVEVKKAPRQPSVANQIIQIGRRLPYEQEKAVAPTLQKIAQGVFEVEKCTRDGKPVPRGYATTFKNLISMLGNGIHPRDEVDRLVKSVLKDNYEQYQKLASTSAGTGIIEEPNSAKKGGQERKNRFLKGGATAQNSINTTLNKAGERTPEAPQEPVVDEQGVRNPVFVGTTTQENAQGDFIATVNASPQPETEKLYEDADLEPILTECLDASSLLRCIKQVREKVSALGMGAQVWVAGRTQVPASTLVQKLDSLEALAHRIEKSDMHAYADFRKQFDRIALPSEIKDELEAKFVPVEARRGYTPMTSDTSATPPLESVPPKPEAEDAEKGPDIAPDSEDTAVQSTPTDTTPGTAPTTDDSEVKKSETPAPEAPTETNEPAPPAQDPPVAPSVVEAPPTPPSAELPKIEVTPPPVAESGEEGVRALRDTYLSIARENGLDGLVAYLQDLQKNGTQTIPSAIEGQVQIKDVLDGISVMGEKYGKESELYDYSRAIVPDGGLREVVDALFRGTSLDEVENELRATVVSAPDVSPTPETEEAGKGPDTAPASPKDGVESTPSAVPTREAPTTETGRDGVRTMRNKYLAAARAGGLPSIEGLLVRRRDVEGKDTVPSQSKGTIPVDEVLETIEKLKPIQDNTRLSIDAEYFRNYLHGLPRGGLREVVSALLTQGSLDDVARELERNDPIASDAKSDGPINEEGKKGEVVAPTPEPELEKPESEDEKKYEISALRTAQRAYYDAIIEYHEQRSDKSFLKFIFDKREAEERIAQAQSTYDALLDDLRNKRDERIARRRESLAKREGFDADKFEKYYARVTAAYETALEKRIEREAKFAEYVRLTADPALALKSIVEARENTYSRKGIEQKNEERAKVIAELPKKPDQKGMERVYTVVNLLKKTYGWFQCTEEQDWKKRWRKRTLRTVGTATVVGALAGASGLVAGGATVAGLVYGGRRLVGGTLGVATALSAKMGMDKVIDWHTAGERADVKETFGQHAPSASRKRIIDITRSDRKLKMGSTAVAGATGFAVGLGARDFIDLPSSAPTVATEIDSAPPKVEPATPPVSPVAESAPSSAPALETLEKDEPPTHIPTPPAPASSDVPTVAEESAPVPIVEPEPQPAPVSEDPPQPSTVDTGADTKLSNEETHAQTEAKMATVPEGATNVVPTPPANEIPSQTDDTLVEAKNSEANALEMLNKYLEASANAPLGAPHAEGELFAMHDNTAHDLPPTSISGPLVESVPQEPTPNAIHLHEVLDQKGESVWSAAKKIVEHDPQFADLTKAEQLVATDAIKDYVVEKVAELKKAGDTDALRKMGFRSGNPDLVYRGDTLDVAIPKEEVFNIRAQVHPEAPVSGTSNIVHKVEQGDTVSAYHEELVEKDSILHALAEKHGTDTVVAHLNEDLAKGRFGALEKAGFARGADIDHIRASVDTVHWTVDDHYKTELAQELSGKSVEDSVTAAPATPGKLPLETGANPPSPELTVEALSTQVKALQERIVELEAQRSNVVASSDQTVPSPGKLESVYTGERPRWPMFSPEHWQKVRTNLGEASKVFAENPDRVDTSSLKQWEASFKALTVDRDRVLPGMTDAQYQLLTSAWSGVGRIPVKEFFDAEPEAKYTFGDSTIELHDPTPDMLKGVITQIELSLLPKHPELKETFDAVHAGKQDFNLGQYFTFLSRKQ